MDRTNANKTKKIINVWEKKRFGNNIASHERKFFPDLLRIAKSSEIILEVGVGTGRMIKLLLENDVQAIFCSIDLVPRSSVPKNFVVADARRLPFKEDAFDLVFSLGVVEHFKETREAVKEHARVLKSGGHILISTPHLSFATVTRVISFYLKKEFKESNFEIVIGRNLTLRKMRKILREPNLKILELEAAGKILFGGSRPPFFSRFIDRMERFFEKIFPREIFGAYLYCLAKK